MYYVPADGNISFENVCTKYNLMYMEFDFLNYTTHHQSLVEGRIWTESSERGRVEVGRSVKGCPLAFNY